MHIQLWSSVQEMKKTMWEYNYIFKNNSSTCIRMRYIHLLGDTHPSPYIQSNQQGYGY